MRTGSPSGCRGSSWAVPIEMRCLAGQGSRVGQHNILSGALGYLHTSAVGSHLSAASFAHVIHDPLTSIVEDAANIGFDALSSGTYQP
jgi:hypothetical protein